MDCSTPGFSDLHYLLELAQAHVHWDDDAIHHPLSYSLPAFSLSQHQGLLQWIGSLHQVAKGLELQLQHQSFQWVWRVDILWDWLLWYPCSPRDSQEFSSTTIQTSILQRSAFFMIQHSHAYMNAGKIIALTTYSEIHIKFPPKLIFRFYILPIKMPT